MDLMTLVAHVTLDTSEYEQALADVQKEADKLSIQESYSLDLDKSDFSKGLEDAEGDAEVFEGNVNSVWEGIKTGLVTAGVAAAITGLFNQLSDCVNLASKLGDNVDKGSKRLNISTEAYQEWSHALTQSGADINDLQRGILSINKLLGGGEVTKSAAEAFEKLGVSTTNASGGLKTTEEYLSDTIKTLADFKGTNEERGALVEAIFGRNGNQLNALFDEGSKGIDGLLKEAHELGLVMTKEEVENAAAYGDAVANVQASMEAFKTSIATDILPALTDVMNTVSKIIAFFNWRTGDTPLSQQFEDIDKGGADALASINATETVAMTLADKLISMGEASKLTAEQQAIWKNTAEELVGIIPSLSELINTDTGEITGNTDAIRENIKAWAEKSRAEAAQQALADKKKALADKTKAWIDAETEANVAAAEAQGELTKAAMKANDVLAELGSDRRAKEDASNINEVLTAAMEDFADDDSAALKLGMVLNEYGEAWTDAAKKKEKALSLQEEVEAGQQELAKYEAAINEVLAGAESSAGSAEEAVEGVGEALDSLPEKKTITIDILAKYPNLNLPGLDFTPHATGAWDIPYDDYPALLHRNEMVLSASQARKYREGGSGQNLAGMSKLIVAAIREGMSDASVNAYVSGQGMTDMINNITSNMLKARRFAP